MTTKVDWNKPIEAVRKSDGYVFPVTFKTTHTVGGLPAYLTNEVPDKSNTNETWYENGSDWCSKDAWYIRNIQTPQWAVDEAISRLNAEWKKKNPHGIHGYTEEALAVQVFAHYIAKYETPPIDPDLIEARSILEAVYKTDICEDLTLGAWENTVPMACAVAGIKRGRELQLQC